MLRYGATSGGPTDLAVPATDPVSRQIEAQSHPGLLVLKRQENDRGKLKTILDVDEVRRLGGFFGMTAEAGGWRAAIIDSADDMNDNAANALLKILEEPPARGLLLLISHTPGRLLPTIRSRTPPSRSEAAGRCDWRRRSMNLLPDTEPPMIAPALARLSEGSLGLALRLAGEDGLKLARDAETLLDGRRARHPGSIGAGRTRGPGRGRA